MGLKVNSSGVSYCESLIEDGKVDTESSWSFTAEDGDALLGANGDDWEAFAKVHLAEDTSATENTKSRWKYPVAKADGKVYREGVIAAKSRSAQQGEDAVTEAADGLLKQIDEKADACKPKKMDSLRKDYIYGAMGVICEGEEDTDMFGLTEALETNRDGFLSGKAVVTNIGVFDYMLPDGKIIKELRLPEEVLCDESLESLRMVPLTLGHPSANVTPATVGALQVGSIGDGIQNDTYRVYAPITINRQDAIEAVRSGMLGLSCGYTCDVEIKSGRWMGVQYDAIQRNIRYNHVAIVDVPRAGDDAFMRLDGASGVRSSYTTLMEDRKMVKLKLDGEVQFDVDPKVAEHVAQLAAKADAATAAKATAEGERDSLKAQVEQLKADAAKQPEAVAAGVAARLALCDSVRAVGIEVKADASDAEIKSLVILKAFPKADLAGKAAEYVQALFDGAMQVLAGASPEVKPAAGSPLFDGGSEHVDSAAARAKMIDATTQAWRPQASK